MIAILMVFAGFGSSSVRRAKPFRHVIEQVIDAQPVLGRDGIQIGDAQRIKIAVSASRATVSILFTASVTGLPSWRSNCPVAVGAGDFGAPSIRKITCAACSSASSRLFEDLRGNEVRVVRDDPAGIDQLEAAALVSARPCRRSRVIPGSSPTMARR